MPCVQSLVIQGKLEKVADGVKRIGVLSVCPWSVLSCPFSVVRSQLSVLSCPLSMVSCPWSVVRWASCFAWRPWRLLQRLVHGSDHPGRGAQFVVRFSPSVVSGHWHVPRCSLTEFSPHRPKQRARRHRQRTTYHEQLTTDN